MNSEGIDASVKIILYQLDESYTKFVGRSTAMEAMDTIEFDL